MRIFLYIFFPLFLLAEAHIFVLHRIDDPRHPYTNTSSKELVKYFEYIKKNNFKVVTLSELVKKIKNRENIDKLVVFNIDDSYKSFYKNGLPLFKKYNYPFTLFVYVKATDNKYGDFMRWDQIKDSLKYGEVGIHSYAHPHLPKLSNKEIIEDTKKAINSFKKHLGFVPNMYAYPYGEYDKRVKIIINKFFDVIANQNPGAIDLSTPINDLDRIALTGKVNIQNKLKLKRLEVKYFHIKKIKDTIKSISGYVNTPYIRLYITNYGWRKIRTHKGFFKIEPNFKLKRYRNRIILRYNYKIFTKMIIKEDKYE